MMEPLDIQRVNVDFTIQMLAELDQMSAELNISRQAVIKMLLMHGLDEHRLAKRHTSVFRPGVKQVR
jgi:metal-responsive CopG/Arc/MetJ family transcriptional regulator